MNRDEAKQLEQELRRFLAEGGDSGDVLARIDEGLADAEDPGVIGLLTLCRTLARQMEAGPDELGAESLAAAELLAEGGEHDAAVFAEAVGGAFLHRAGDVDTAARIAVRTLAAVERMPATEEWGSRTAHCLGLLFGDLHAYELASRSSARALDWHDARTDPMTRLTIETVSAYFAIRAAESHPVTSPERDECLALIDPALAGLRDLGTPAADVARNSIEAELSFLDGTTPDPDELSDLTSVYEHCAPPWVAWHELVRGRALNDLGRFVEASACLRGSIDKRWTYGETAARRELVRSLAGIGETEQALAELQDVLADLDAFVRSHVARQATDLRDRVDAEKRSAELRERSEHLADQVAHDHLTGVASRRALDQELDRSVDGSASHAVLVCDLDHFKLINDAYGHSVGDDVLRTIGRILREHARDGDVVGRFGGEEFVIVLAGNVERGAHAAERLRAAVEHTDWQAITADLRVTVSIGVAAGTAPLRDLLRAADLAVYDAKNDGRNRVALARGGHPASAPLTDRHPH